MQKIKFACVLLFIIIVYGACSSSKKATTESSAKTIDGNWQNTSIVADGNSSEWNKSQVDYDNKSNIAYKITNDADNLYILLFTIDNRTQMKILSSGLSVFIDPTGKKKETTFISYPLKSEIPSPALQIGMRPELQQIKAMALINANEYALTGFKTGNGGYSIMQKNAAQVQVRMALDSSNELAYEAIIPLQSLFNGENAAQAGRKFSIGFKINGLTKPDNMNSGGMPDRGSMPGGGGGMPSGGGGMPPPGGMSQMEMNDMQKQSVNVMIWKSVTLAVK